MTGVCKKCEKEKRLIGRGLCPACYHRARRLAIAGVRDDWTSETRLVITIDLTDDLNQIIEGLRDKIYQTVIAAVSEKLTASLSGN